MKSIPYFFILLSGYLTLCVDIFPVGDINTRCAHFSERVLDPSGNEYYKVRILYPNGYHPQATLISNICGRFIKIEAIGDDQASNNDLSEILDEHCEVDEKYDLKLKLPLGLDYEKVEIINIQEVFNETVNLLIVKIPGIFHRETETFEDTIPIIDKTSDEQNDLFFLTI